MVKSERKQTETLIFYFHMRTVGMSYVRTIQLANVNNHRQTKEVGDTSSSTCTHVIGVNYCVHVMGVNYWVYSQVHM